jgi:hypothetical protein
VHVLQLNELNYWLASLREDKPTDRGSASDDNRAELGGAGDDFYGAAAE